MLESELGGHGLQPILAKRGAPWEALRILPTLGNSCQRPDSCIPPAATAATEALVPEAECSTTFSWHPGLLAAQESYCTCEKSEVSACFHLLGEGKQKQILSLLNVLFIQQEPSPKGLIYGSPICP